MRLKDFYENAENIAIGQQYKGGIIGSIYTLNTKSYILICKTLNKKISIITELYRNTDNDGYSNTYKNRHIEIFDEIASNHFNDYNDWYIPSIEELSSLDINTANNKIFLSSSKKGKSQYVANIKSPIKLLSDKNTKYDLMIMRREETIYNPLQKVASRLDMVDL